jgi:DNA invertase Pin-like site-specific DNA recombinase/predicted metal-dependent hydrolase
MPFFLSDKGTSGPNIRNANIMPQYVVYCRKSTESEEKQVLSIDSQIEELKEFSERMDLPVSAILAESKSAKLPGRPVFNEMMKKLSRGQYTGVVCWKLDRLARNPIDGSALVWALDQGKIKEILTPHGSFKNNSNDKFLMQIEFGMAKKYVDDLSDNVKRGLRAKLERGWLPALPPLGYLNEPTERTIVKDPVRFPLIRRAWDLLFEGHSASRILAILNNEYGFRTRLGKKSGGKPLSRSGLYGIFGNPFYYGLIKSKEGTYSGKQDRMITEEEFWKAQEILGRKGKPRLKKHEFAFTGLIRCGECGCGITAEEKVNRYGYHYTYYHCTKKKIGCPCHQKCISLTELEGQITAFLRRIHVPQLYLDMALDYLSEKEKEESPKSEDIRRSQEKAMADCEKKLKNLKQMRMRDLINDEEFLEEKRTLMKEKVSLEMNRNRDPRKQATAKAIETFTFAGRALDRFQNGTPEDKRSVLQEAGSNLSLKDKILTIDAEKPLQFIEKGLHSHSTPNLPLEPRNEGVNKGGNTSFVPDFKSWCTTVDDVRTFFMSLPETELEDCRQD